MSQILLGIGIALGSGTTEAVEGLVLLSTEPVGQTQRILGTLVVAYRQQQAQGLVMAVAAVGGEQLAGLIDGGSSGIGHVVVVDADVA